jgi:hypothetical protein
MNALWIGYLSQIDRTFVSVVRLECPLSAIIRHADKHARNLRIEYPSRKNPGTFARGFGCLVSKGIDACNRIRLPS